MGLLCLDLDNTLIDRTGAYREWAVSLVDRHGLDPHETGWLMEVDLDGFARRDAVFAAIHDRYALDGTPEDLLADYRRSVPHLVRPYDGCIEALTAARARGWHPWLVTNGAVDVQESKVAATGLGGLLEGWVISDEVGVRKPDPAIFDLCASRSGIPLEGAWMIGDSSHTDIAGAHNAGVRSVWLHRNRDWEEPVYCPTAQAASITEALELIGAPTP